jgi:hypothetical protein
MKNILSTLILLFFAQLSFAQNCDDANKRAFDFWLGRWIVYQNGEPVGTSSIYKSKDDCGIDEKWKSSTGSPGSSHNFYNTKTKQWEQHWIDESGWKLDLYGNPDGDKTMVLKSKLQKDWEGKESMHELRWEVMPLGAVIQIWNASYDGGKTWKEIFRGQYERAY